MTAFSDKFELIFEKRVEDLDSQALLFRHKKSGARVFFLSNDDDNKVFFVGFRTPPSDSTGVPHIMEHSTLCGSEKFPLKDPFVELIKGSLNTFLNAMTFSDKTVYPVASCNKQDFRNLMDVYMDAVFHPNVYHHPEILKQEGWSYRIESPEDQIEYNGVVYNEMKGAFSSPDDVLMREIMNSLFPDTSYGVESGGDPKYIPDLTYEAFLDFHRRFYHPSNSYIYLYGDVDIEEQLEWLDKEYLNSFDAIKTESDIAVQQAFDDIRIVEKEYPIMDDEDEEDNTYLSYNMVCGSALDVRESYAMQMLTYALIDTQGAPIRQRLLDEGIGKDILSAYYDGILQPYLSVVAKNANADQKERFVSIINEELKKAADGGLNRKSLLAGLSTLEFKYREADYGGLPKGLIYGISSLNGWLYDDNEPLLYLELGDVFAELKKLVDTDYYENLIRDRLLSNPHSSVVILKPSKGLAARNEAETAQKLAAFKDSLTPEEIDKLVEETKALAAYQAEPSTREELETIPLLSRDDIEREPKPISNIEEEVCGVPFISHDHSTNGIAYISLMFDCNGIGRELLPYLGLLKSVISFVDTESYSYSELNNEINIASGSFGMETGIYEKCDGSGKVSIISDLSTRVLYDNIEKAFELIGEVLLTGKYSDKRRLYEIIAELKSKLQMSLMSAGHVAASLRASSYFSVASALKEQINGLEFYKFVEELEEHFDERSDDLITALEKIVKIAFTPDNLLVSCTCDNAGRELVKAAFESFKAKLDAFAGKAGEQKNDLAFADRSYDFYGQGLNLERKNEAFRTSGAVNYIARAGRFIDSPDEYTGAVRVFRSIMNFEYMWFNIRVQGGAYGCMSGSSPTGNLYFVTYRDPHIRRSNDIFEGIPEYLESFSCDEREMTKYVIGTMSDIDIPLTPALKGSRDISAYLTGETMEQKRRIRNEIIDCTVSDIRGMAPLVRRALADDNICCLGCESQVNEDAELFDSVRNLFE